jgi:hypothetical protein
MQNQGQIVVAGNSYSAYNNFAVAGSILMALLILPFKDGILLII